MNGHVLSTLYGITVSHRSRISNPSPIQVAEMVPGEHHPDVVETAWRYHVGCGLLSRRNLEDADEVLDMVGRVTAAFL